MWQKSGELGGRKLFEQAGRSPGRKLCFAEPIGIFAKGLSVEAQVRVRIDDKLSRLARGSEFAEEDTVLDLIGYLVLLRVLQQREGTP